MKVYLKEEIPDRFPCFNSMKIQPVILVTDEGSESGVCICVFRKWLDRFLVRKFINKN